MAAKPLIAPPPSEFRGSFSAPVTISGTVSGYYNANANQPPLFTVNVVGRGMVSGAYRFIDDGDGHPFYFGANVKGYVSADGVSWTLVGNAAATLSGITTQLGPVVTSHDPGTLNTATFDNVEVRLPE